MVELELVGRHALLFDDDANAMFVNSEEALVDWNSLLIDRYDVRHLLSGPPPPRNRRRQVVPHADASIAMELDRERYLDLASDEQEQDVNEELLPVTDDGYRAVGFSYGYQDEMKELKNEVVETIYRPPFPVPESLSQNLPPTEKVHQIIARTATFVSEHGGQSEIVLRVKQGDNPTFGFLMPDHNLHSYFRFLVDHQELLKASGNGEKEKAGAETPGQTGGALSLLGSIYGDDEEEDGAVVDLPNSKISKLPENTEAVGSNISQGSESLGNTSVKNQTVLNNSLKEKVSAIKRNPSINSVKSVAASVPTKTAPIISKVELPVVEPPSELKRVVEKIVEFILRNGKEFEAVLAEQDRKFGRFPFLLPTSIYHSYYLQVLQKAQQSKLTGKASVSEKHEPGRSGKEKKTLPRDDASPSTGISNGDKTSNNSDRKEKFKMALGKPKMNEQEIPPKVEQQPYEIVLDAEVTAAILKAATSGIKHPGLEIFPKIKAISETQSTSEAEAEAEADSSEASLTKEQRVKAERLKRAKMFAAMIKNGAAPLKSDPSRGLSVEPAGSGVSSSGNEIANPKVGLADLETSEAIKRLEKKAVIDECTERRSRRTYRPRSSKEEDEEDEDVEEDERDNRRSRKKHRSHRSSRHSRERRSHKKRHSELSDDDDEEWDSRHRHKRRSSVDRDHDDDHDDDRQRTSRKRRKDYDRFSDDDDDQDWSRRSRTEKRRERRSRKGDLEEGEILDRSKKTFNETGQKPSADLLKSPSELTVVPDDLRAKVRAMLMATM